MEKEIELKKSTIQQPQFQPPIQQPILQLPVAQNSLTYGLIALSSNEADMAQLVAWLEYLLKLSKKQKQTPNYLN